MRASSVATSAHQTNPNIVTDRQRHLVDWFFAEAVASVERWRSKILGCFEIARLNKRDLGKPTPISPTSPSDSLWPGFTHHGYLKTRLKIGRGRGPVSIGRKYNPDRFCGDIC